MRLLLGIGDLSDDDVRTILDRARGLSQHLPASAEPQSRVLGLLFASSSTRTRVGFAVAAARLGWSSVEVSEMRWSPEMSAGESFLDTLRTLGGMVDVVVVRTPFSLLREEVAVASPCHVVNGGDAGEHPTQALIDLLAIEAEAGPLGGLRICICGDLGMRAVISLARLFERFPPRSLMLVSPPGRDVLTLTAALESRTTRTQVLDPAGLDVLYMPGLPQGEGNERLDDGTRAAYAVDDTVLAGLPPDAVVLCPLPAIDEISAAARHDPRVRMFEQSDRGVFVRMAVLDLITASDS